MDNQRYHGHEILQKKSNNRVQSSQLPIIFMPILDRYFRPQKAQQRRQCLRRQTLAQAHVFHIYYPSDQNFGLINKINK